MKHINLETFANGAFTAQVNRAFREVIENISFLGFIISHT